MCGAGLPQFEDELESDDAATFMQRCSRYDMERLDTAATRLAISKPVEDRGACIDPEALDRAVVATSGYAFMVGAREVAKGIAEAQRRIGRLGLDLGSTAGVA